MHRRTFLGSGAVVASFLAGCTGGGGGGTGGETDGDGNDETRAVTMTGTDFNPREMSIQPGTTVEWVNEGSAGHTVEAASFTDGADSWSFESGTIGGGDSATHTFEEAGVYQYYCTVHGKSTMCGVVLVGGESMDGSLPCASGGGGGGGDDGDDGGGIY